MTSIEFENHQVFDKLEQLKNRINEKGVRELMDADTIHFFETSENYLRDRLKLTIPIIVQESELSQISVEIESSLSQINAFIGNKNVGHINNAINNLHSAISRVRNLPLPFSKNDFNFSKNISNFEKVVQEKYKEIETENKKLKETIEGFKIEISNNLNELNNINTKLSQKESEIQNLNSTFQTDFLNIKSTSNQNYENDRNAFRIEFDNLKQSLINEVNTTKGEISSNTEILIEDLNSKLQEAKKIVGVIGDISVTGNYHKFANENKSTANTFRVLAIVLMLLLSGLLIFTIWDISSANFDWTKSLIRIIAAAALSYPATYAARESSKHRKLEIINRKAELELTAINPFIELLPENKKHEVKEKLVAKYFGNNSNHVDDEINQKDDEISVSGLDTVLKTILPYLKK
ncbi:MULTISPECIES: hypothetical protein [Flavobacterium]|uniref:hypothetical protein n=1 Tax=Flavobacterium TaxID=237 RepID=UPI001FCB1263|nr:MULTISPECIES: hypothetical protein [Flavobacterium]UOK43405.1 hypothetical protein LZF87_04610 [Flavobacterium enshiense]